MSVFKHIVFILTIFCVALPIQAMDACKKELLACIQDIHAGDDVSENAKIDAFILSDSAQRELCDAGDWTPLHIAALFNRAHVARVLFKKVDDASLHNAIAIRQVKEIDVNVQNSNDETPLHIAAQVGAVEVAQVLLTHGAHVNAKNYCGQTPLHKACKKQHFGMIALLLEHGAQITEFDEKGTTLFHKVIKTQNYFLFHYVLERTLFCQRSTLEHMKARCSILLQQEKPDDIVTLIQNYTEHRLKNIEKLLRDPRLRILQGPDSLPLYIMVHGLGRKQYQDGVTYQVVQSLLGLDEQEIEQFLEQIEADNSGGKNE